MKRLNNKEVRALNAEFCLELSKHDIVTRSREFVEVNGTKYLFSVDGRWVPTLHLLRIRICLPSVIVDAGAVKFVTNGADIMRPGITRIGEFSGGEYVVVLEETHFQPLAVGKALFCSDELRSMEKGKVIEIVHYLGDEIWG